MIQGTYFFDISLLRGEANKGGTGNKDKFYFHTSYFFLVATGGGMSCSWGMMAVQMLVLPWSTRVHTGVIIPLCAATAI
jgi:hypothetical protein